MKTEGISLTVARSTKREVPHKYLSARWERGRYCVLMALELLVRYEAIILGQINQMRLSIGFNVSLSVSQRILDREEPYKSLIEIVVSFHKLP